MKADSKFRFKPPNKKVKKKKKKTITKILTVIRVLALIFSFAVMIFTVVMTLTIKKRDGEIFGYRLAIVLTDSMKDEFQSGDIVIAKKVDTSTLVNDDIIMFKSPDPRNLNEVVTHKIRAVVKNGPEVSFLTYGTTTNADDIAPIKSERVLGKYVGHLPKVGKFFDLLKTKSGYIVIVCIPFLLLILFEVRNFILLLKDYKAGVGAKKELANKKEKDMEEELRELRKKVSDLQFDGLDTGSDSMDDETIADSSDSEKDD